MDALCKCENGCDLFGGKKGKKNNCKVLGLVPADQSCPPSVVKVMASA